MFVVIWKTRNIILKIIFNGVVNQTSIKLFLSVNKNVQNKFQEIGLLLEGCYYLTLDSQDLLSSFPSRCHIFPYKLDCKNLASYQDHTL